MDDFEKQAAKLKGKMLREYDEDARAKRWPCPPPPEDGDWSNPQYWELRRMWLQGFVDANHPAPE